MHTLVRGKNSTGKAGEPIPTVFPALARSTVHFRRGQFTLIAAAPGVGKSLVALTAALDAGVPTFYFSADSDAFTMYVRSGAKETGWTTGEVETQVQQGNTLLIDSKLDQKSAHLRFSFDTNPDFDTVEEELLAYAATYGCWPTLLVFDNISNVETESGEGQVALEAVCDYLHALARKTGAAVLGLHHVTGEYDDGTKPVPLSGLRGKISKIPEQVLTLFRNQENPGRMGVTVVKNRMGKSDPSGAMVIWLDCELERMRVG